MAKNSTFNVSIKLLSQQFSKGIANIQRQIKGVGNFIKGAFAIGSITAFGRQMIQVGSQFEDSMARVQAVSNATTEEFKMMQKEAQRLGETTRYTASEAANALENLTRNGMSASDATKSLSSVLKLAQANAIGLAEAADILTNTMNMFGLSAKDTERINDVLSATSATTATNITLLYEALVNAAPAANVLGFSLEEVSAAIGALAQSGVKGANAGTALRMALTKMADPKIIAKMNAMGVAIDEQTMKSEGLLKTIGRLKDAELGLTDLVAIFSQKGAVGMQQLINAYDEFESELETVQNASGTTTRMFEQGVGTTKGAIDTLRSAYEGFLIMMSQKTSGVVNSVIKHLTSLIKNFQTVGGTIANIAAVAIPLVVAGIRKIQAAYTAAGAKIVSVSAAIKVAIGNWATLIATIITWVGVDLVTAWNKNSAAMREAKKEFEKTESKIADLKRGTDNLISKLSSGDSKSLNSVVREAIELFPDFADKIRRAADEAKKTGNYDKLKTTLQEICGLQEKMMTNAATQGVYDAVLERGAEKMKANAKKEGLGLKNLAEWMKSQKLSEQQQINIYKTILDKRVKGASKKEIDEFIQSVTGGVLTGINFNQAGANVGLTSIVGTLRSLKDEIENNNKVIDDAIEAENAAAEAAAKAAEKKAEEDAAREEAEEEAKRVAKQKAAVDTNFANSIKKAQAELAAGIIDTAEYTKRYNEALKRAWEDLAEITGDYNNNKYSAEYFSRASLAEFSKNSKNLSDSAKKLGQAAQAVTLNTPGLAGQKPTGKNDVDINIDTGFDFDEFSDGFKDTLSAVDALANGLGSLEDCFNTLSDSESTWIEKLQAAIRIMQATAAMVSALKTLYNALAVAETTAAAAEGAATGGASLIGSILAVAAPLLISLLGSGTSGFAEGGVITGGSLNGDKSIVRVNSGEMILNGTQQKRLLALANGGSSPQGSSQVEFFISGKNLRGVLNNVDKAQSKIKGRL